MDRINILHLSDAHMTKRREVDQQMVLSAFFNDLQQICDSDLAPHYVVVSGDLVNDPDEPDAYNHFTEQLLFPLLEATSIDLDNFIFFPGNHDVSRDVCKTSPLEFDALASKLGDHKYFNDLYAKDGFPQLVKDKFVAYSSFVHSLSASHSNKVDIFYNIWDYPSSQLTFVALNSSLLSLATLAGVEQGRLCFPDLAANKAFIAIAAERLIISVQHHPLSWFQELTANELQKTINHKSRLHLYGHLHEAIPNNLSSVLGTTTLIQSPSLFSSRDSLNGYSIISIAPDRKRIAVTFRTSYFESRRSFGSGENVVEDGIFYPNQESYNYWCNQPLRINLRKFRRWLTENALIEKIDFYNETTVAKKLSDVFVCPPLMRIEVKKKDEQNPGDPFTYTKVSYDRLFEFENNLLLFFPPEHGQSSFVKKVALDYILRNSELAIPRLPLIVDCTHLRKYEASLVGLLKAQAPDLVSLGKNLNVILEEGLGLIIFENVNPIDKEKTETIREFMNNFNRNRFMIVIRSGFSESVDTLLDLQFPNVTDTLHIQAFTRSLVREFIRKWKLPLRASEDVTLDQVITRFRELGLPLTPVYLTLLFSVYEQDISFRPTNTASLVENFVEKVLGKSTGDLGRGIFDFKNSIPLLAYLAERMIAADTYVVDYAQIYQWSDEYLKGIDLKEDIYQLVTRFTKSGIFSLTGNSVQFRHDMFLAYFLAQRLAYFLAQRMISNVACFKSITGQPYRFCQEIDIFCGLRRFDVNVIEIVSARFADVDKRLKEQFPLLPSLSYLDDFELPKDESIEAMLLAVTDQLTSKSITESERDKMLDNEADKPAAAKRLQRPEAKLVAIEWFKTLRAYTIALKNLEEIGGDRKEAHMAVILEAWARAVAYLIMIVRIAFETSIEVGGVQIDLGKQFGESRPFVLRCLFITLPVVISGLLRTDLATEKLGPILSNTDPSGNEPVAVRFLNEMLYLDLRLAEYMRRTRKFLESIRGKRYFSESLLIKLQEGYLRFRLEDDSSDTEYRSLLAELTADISGARGAERDRAIGKQMQEMKKQQMIAKLKGE